MIQRGQQTSIFHRYVRHGDTLYVSGLVGSDLTQSIGGQTRDIALRLADILREAGTDTSRILQSTVYITDMSLKNETTRPGKKPSPGKPSHSGHNRRRRPRPIRADRSDLRLRDLTKLHSVVRKDVEPRSLSHPRHNGLAAFRRCE